MSARVHVVLDRDVAEHLGDYAHNCEKCDACRDATRAALADDSDTVWVRLPRGNVEHYAQYGNSALNRACRAALAELDPPKRWTVSVSPGRVYLMEGTTISESLGTDKPNAEATIRRLCDELNEADRG